MLILTLCLFAADPLPLPLDTLTIERARPLNGRSPPSPYLVAKSTSMWKGRRSLGPMISQTVPSVVLISKGRVTTLRGLASQCKGKLLVIDHAVAFVNGKFVMTWVEIRAEEGK